MKLNVTLISIKLLLLLAMMSEQAHAQYWMQHASSGTVEEALGIDEDGNGNTYTTGYITVATTFGTNTANTNGGSDMFLAKTNSTGGFDWVVNGGGTSTDRGNAVACDANGNVYVTGFFNGTGTFGSSSITSAGSQDVFVAKYNSGGNLQWVVRAGGAGADIANGISIDNSGNVLIAGQFSGVSTFGTTTLTSVNSSIDIFVAKISSAGSFIWAKQGAGKFEDRALSISCDGSGNSYVTGQFSDTLTIDQTHNNAMQNAIFVLKLSSTGSETWFKIVGGGGFNICYDIITDNSGNSYITGDYQGTLTFFGSPPLALTSTENFKSFIAKYSASGSVSWAQKIGSSNEISARSIDIDNSGNAYIVGYFECILDEFSLQYGEATFNSVGEEDIYMAKYSSSGNFIHAKHLGNSSEAKANGVAVKANNQAVFCGVFSGSINIPTSGSFNATNLALWNNISCQSNLSYCGDANYGKYHQINGAGNRDIIIANCFDANREPYDFFLRSGSGCNRNYKKISVAGGASTITVCDVNSVGSIPIDSNICDAISPNQSYSWQSIAGPGTGSTKILKQSFGNCTPFSKDSVILNNYPGGPIGKPNISDDVVVNVQAELPQLIEACNPSTVQLTAGNVGSNNIHWNYQQAFYSNNNPITVSQTGLYTIVAEDVNGCSDSTSIYVVFYDTIPTFNLGFELEDSVSYCDNAIGNIQYLIYDMVNNPLANDTCFIPEIPNTNILQWQGFATASVTPGGATVSQSCGGVMGFFSGADSGWNVINIEFIFRNKCDTDYYYFTDSVFITHFPSPEPQTFNFSITGPEYICPGDTVDLVASADTSFTWFGSGVNGQTTDTVSVTTANNFNISFSFTDTNQFGCTQFNVANASHTTYFVAQPVITSDTTFLCPGDTTLIWVSSSGPANQTYQWQAPWGNLGINNDTIQAYSSGLYYCFVGDSGCIFESNVIEIIQYTTPDINAAGSPVLCSGDSVILYASASNSTAINWFFPLSGNDPYQTVFESGIYECEITSCGITSVASIEVIPSTSSIDIFKDGVLCTDSFTSLSVDTTFEIYDWSHSILDTYRVFVTDTGYYHIMALDSDGCTVTDTAYVDLDQIFADIETDNSGALCFGDTITIDGVPGLTTYLWIPTNETTPNIQVIGEGTYTLVATDSNGCRSTSDPTVIFTPDTTAKVQINGNLSFCEGDSVLLSTPIKGKESYSWNPDLSDSNAIVISESGTYTVNVIDTFGCLAKSAPISVFVQKFLLNTPFMNDTTICMGDQANFFTDVIGTVIWHDSTNDQRVLIGNNYTTPSLFENTTYYVWSEDGFCATDSISIDVNVIDCDNIFIPNYLTPNGDGVNDLFKATLPEHTCFKMYIYNRWGALVHLSEHINTGWDGAVINSGELASEGTYYYIIEYCSIHKDNLVSTGSLTLIRE